MSESQQQQPPAPTETPVSSREAEVLISVDDANISEIHGADRVIVAKHVEAMIVSIVPTPEELANATEQLGLLPGTLKADGRPLVFVLAGDYKIPVCVNVPTIQEGPRQFVFTVPNLWMCVTLPEDCDEETAEAFGMLIKTYGKLNQQQGGSSRSSVNRGSGAQQHQLPPQKPTSNTYPAGTVAGGGPVPAGYPTGNYGGGAQPEQQQQQQSRDMPAGYPTGGGGGGYTPTQGGNAYGEAYPAGAQGGMAGYPAGAVAVQPAVTADGRPLSTKVAGGVTFLARGLIKGIHKGRDVAVGGIGKGSGKVIEKTKACEQPVHVPVEYQAKMAKARATTKSAVVLTGTVTTALVGVSAMLGSGVAGVAGKVIPGGVASRVVGGPQNKYIAGIKEVGGAVIGAGACVFVEATDSARAVLTAGTEGVTDVVGHRYGGEVGAMTGNGLGVVTDGVTVVSNVRNIGVKAVAKNAAKHAGGQIMDDMDLRYGDGSSRNNRGIQSHHHEEAPYQQQIGNDSGANNGYPSLAPPPAAQGYPQPPQQQQQQHQGAYPQGYPSG